MHYHSLTTSQSLSQSDGNHHDRRILLARCLRGTTPAFAYKNPFRFSKKGVKW